MAPTVGGSRARGNRALLGLHSGQPSNLFAPDLRVFPTYGGGGYERRKARTASTRRWSSGAGATDELDDDVRVDRRPAACDTPDRLEKAVDLEHAVLEQVAESFGALA